MSPLAPTAVSSLRACVTVDGFRKTLLLDAGQVRFAASEDPEDRIGTRLVRRGVITLEQLERVVERLDSGPRIGSLLVDDGSLTPEQLVDEIRLQTRDIALPRSMLKASSTAASSLSEGAM